ncbi:helix-turn-helix transcriptional regulator [Roseiflexus sp. AH-315-K22]|nr:helix-turn-helix transcriptional regulator [Roseiflexus sp. AH-315-K22]
MTSMSNTSAVGDLAGSKSTPPVHPAFVWEALVQDTQCCIALAEIDGTIRYLNSSEQVCACGFESCPFAGLSKVTDDLPREQAEQLLACMKRAHENNAPIVLVWFLKGVRARTVVRPVKTDQGPLILLTTRSARGVDIADASQGEGEVVHSLVGDAGPLASLTQRETEVLEMIGRGFSTAKIAETLNRSTKTIEWHRASIGNKLNASNRVELARIAISAGLTAL